MATKIFGRQAERIADEDRDVLLEDIVDGTGRVVVVECKHTGTVGAWSSRRQTRPSFRSISTDSKRRMGVTTGQFTEPAEEYAERFQQNDDFYPIDLIDGETPSEIADEIGLNLYNCRIKILCDKTL